MIKSPVAPRIEGAPPLTGRSQLLALTLVEGS